LGLLLSLATVVSGQQGGASAVDAAFAAYWRAGSVADAERAGRQIVATGASFAEVLARLRAGRTYAAERTGVRELPTTLGGLRLDNTLTVPTEYNPARRWPLRVQLHGGVGRPAPGPGDAPARGLTGNRIPSEAHLILQPRAWADAEWWRPEQVDNILKLVAEVKRRYNVDEAQTYLTGISDGGTGTYYLAMREASLWSACLPLNGHPLVLANPDVGADGQLYVGNLVNCPIQAVNGGRDQLYPASSVEPFVAMMKRAGVDLTWHVHPDARHDTSWWPVERPSFEQFVRAHPRPPHPDLLSWETERTDRANRYRWLVITGLGKGASDLELPEVNTFVSGTREFPLYERRRPSGRVDATRRGNRFELQTRNVRTLTLLLHAEHTDFSRDVEVVVNGRTVFSARVTPDVATMVRWAARDDDRTSLYGAEIRITVP